MVEQNLYFIIFLKQYKYKSSSDTNVFQHTVIQ